MGRKPSRNYSELYSFVLDDYKNNKSLRDIGVKFNLHPEQVRRILKKNGIEIRKMSEAMVVYHKNKGENNELGL